MYDDFPVASDRFRELLVSGCFPKRVENGGIHSGFPILRANGFPYWNGDSLGADLLGPCRSGGTTWPNVLVQQEEIRRVVFGLQGR